MRTLRTITILCALTLASVACTHSDAVATTTGDTLSTGSSDSATQPTTATATTAPVKLVKAAAVAQE
jgi:hypothetical protein